MLRNQINCSSLATNRPFLITQGDVIFTLIMDMSNLCKSHLAPIPAARVKVVALILSQQRSWCPCLFPFYVSSRRAHEMMGYVTLWIVHLRFPICKEPITCTPEGRVPGKERVKVK